MSESKEVMRKRMNAGNKKKKRLKESPKELHEDQKIVPKYKNYLNFLSSRELGAAAGLQAEKEFYRIKTSCREKSAYSNLKLPFCYHSCEVNFIRGDDSQVCGMWSMRRFPESYTYYVIGDINIDNATQHYNLSAKIVDICPGNGSNVTAPDYSPQDPPRSIKPYIYPLSKRSYNRYSPPPWYCCCYADWSDAAILGGDGYIAYIADPGSPSLVRVPGKVYTASHLMLSRVGLLGLHTGNLWIYDYRAHNVDSCSIKISDEAINDSLFLNYQEVIATDVNGKLVKVDLRTKKTSAEFFGHRHSVTKRPFSVANDMLCATGVDNVVRIWHISGGHPIHILNSTSGHEVRGWLNRYGSKTHLNYFERDTRTVFTI